MSRTFYWHDYETFGVDPSRDRPVQFAGLRTDEDLNVIGEPLVLFAAPARDVLPHPEACLVTGITPQRALAEGVPEYDFIRRIHEELARPGTCGVGYNSIRFDDEVTRYTLYRNFYDPYAREYKQGNSRWDLIDVVRMACALRPEGIEWPRDEDGRVSFRLERLTEANGISHAAAHDALSDVQATIAIARLLRERQPQLFDYALSLRSKDVALSLLDLDAMRPVLHVSGMFGAQRHNIALVAPVVRHPVNRNEIICVDLGADVSPLEDLNASELAARLFTPTDQLPEGALRPGIKSVHINRSPMLITPRVLDAAAAERLAIDADACLANQARLLAIQGLREKLTDLYRQRQHAVVTDPDRMLYSGGFFSDADRRQMDRLREASQEALASESFVFEDDRLPEMLFRYRARNFPDSLSDAERAQWEEQRFQYLTEPDAGASITLEEYQERIQTLSASAGEAHKRVLDALQDYGDSLLSP
ncbi:MAG: exodeoxyribonuclease I [Halieaceae bacterium]|nr:exodeoxyribonuclease I [Halieaceae bacterium]